ncbi:reverse transcriptase domain-containing protein [Tanacetum coccineum]
MADNRTMAQMLQAPIEGYEDAIVVPPINANNFELKQPLINLVQSNKFTDGEARGGGEIGLDTKNHQDQFHLGRTLFQKSINQYFPPSKTTYYRNEIITFYQKPNEAFNEAWERFKGLLRQCPHHGFSELHQLDTFYNSLNSNDQDALDSAAGGNFLDKMPQEGLAIIESKSKVRYSRSRANDSKCAASLEDKMTIKMNQMMSQMKALVVTPAPVKAVEEVCVTCGSNHNFNLCPLTRDFESYVKANDAVLKNVQNQNQGLQNQMANVTSLLTSLCDNFKNPASTSNSGTLPSQTVTIPRQQINAITKERSRLWKNLDSYCSYTDVSKNIKKEPENKTGDV